MELSSGIYGNGYKNLDLNLLRQPVDILCVSETWLTDKSESLLPRFDKYGAIWSNATREKSLGKASGGLLILLDKSKCDPEILAICDWWIFIKILINNEPTIDGLIYLKPKLKAKIKAKKTQKSA